MNPINLITKDPWLEPYRGSIQGRLQRRASREAELAGKGSLKDFASGHLWFGLHYHNEKWIIREWLPHATEVYFLCGQNEWKADPDFAFTRGENGNWELRLKEEVLAHQDHYKLLVRWEGGQGERIPAWSRRVVQDPESKLFDAQVWKPKKGYDWKHENPKLEKFHPLIYEAHVGMATEELRVGSYAEFRLKVLPHIASLGYNTVQLMAIQEHPYYGSFGYHVSNFFAPSSRFGTPEELKEDVAASDLVLSEDIINRMTAISNEFVDLLPTFPDMYGNWNALNCNFNKWRPQAE